jgi:flagella basal body P-ring formation protein FlgA
MRFTLVTGDGAAIPVSVVMTVVGDRVLASHALERGQTITRADLAASRGELSGVPLQRLPTIADLAGGKTLRPIAAGDVVLRGFVAARRTVEPGDRVIATAAAGAVEVSGEFTAADAGAVGDVIRVVNPATKRYLRGRVVKEGHVEVIDGR